MCMYAPPSLALSSISCLISANQIGGSNWLGLGLCCVRTYPTGTHSRRSSGSQATTECGSSSSPPRCLVSETHNQSCRLIVCLSPSSLKTTKCEKLSRVQHANGLAQFVCLSVCLSVRLYVCLYVSMHAQVYM
jgi:hypothetical protein